MSKGGGEVIRTILGFRIGEDVEFHPRDPWAKNIRLGVGKIAGFKNGWGMLLVDWADGSSGYYWPDELRKVGRDGDGKQDGLPEVRA